GRVWAPNSRIWRVTRSLSKVFKRPKMASTSISWPATGAPRRLRQSNQCFKFEKALTRYDVQRPIIKPSAKYKRIHLTTTSLKCTHDYESAGYRFHLHEHLTMRCRKILEESGKEPAV